MIYETNIPDYFDNTNVMNLNEVKFRMAFTVEGFLDKKRKDDPRYVKYLLSVKGRVEGDKYERFFLTMSAQLMIFLNSIHLMRTQNINSTI